MRKHVKRQVNLLSWQLIVLVCDDRGQILPSYYMLPSVVLHYMCSTSLGIHMEVGLVFAFMPLLYLFLLYGTEYVPGVKPGTYLLHLIGHS